MKIYVLATNLFAIAALLMAVESYIRRTRTFNLLPLFLLVVSRSLVFIGEISLSLTQQSGFIQALNLFSLLCILLILIEPFPWTKQPIRWIFLGFIITSVGLALLVTIPFWSVPPQINGILMAMMGAVFIFLTSSKLRWLHLIIPFVLAVTHFFELLELTNVSGFMMLIGYALLIWVIHQRNIDIFADRERGAQDLVEEAFNLTQERQRLLDAIDAISQVPNLSQSLEHIVRTVAQLTHSDQAAIFVLNPNFPQEARLLTLYSPYRPFHISGSDDVVCLLAKCPALQTAITDQSQMLCQDDFEMLRVLYQMWDEPSVGPTLLQPLLIQGRPIGALLVGNPISQASIRQDDVDLIALLAGQIAILVESRYRYIKLEREAEEVTTTVKKRIKAPDQQLSAILEKISDGVVVSNNSGRVQFVNRAAEQILGKSGRTLIGQSIGSIYREIDAKEPVDDFMSSFERRDQALPTFVERDDRSIQGRLIPWRGNDSEWLGIIAIFRDVTREVKADQARNDFITALSHELRAPLTTVKGYSELIMNGMMGDYPLQHRKTQQIIYSGTERIVEILDNAVKTSTENRHRVLPRYEEANVHQVIHQTIQEVRPLVEMQELYLSHKIAADIPSVMVDVQHLYRILYNLLSNACRFTPPGGRIVIKAWVQSDPQDKSDQPYLCISVTDTGIGIPANHLERIFDRYYKINHPILMHYTEGMGLGLTVVKELVELHNGRVWAESVLGKGSLFQVILPISAKY